MQLLAGANLIDFDFSLKKIVCFSGAQKREFFPTSYHFTLRLIDVLIFVFALITSLRQATVYVLTGLYGQPRDTDIIQLIVAALIVILCSKKDMVWARASISS